MGGPGHSPCKHPGKNPGSKEQGNEGSIGSFGGGNDGKRGVRRLPLGRRGGCEAFRAAAPGRPRSDGDARNRCAERDQRRGAIGPFGRCPGYARPTARGGRPG